MYLPLGFLIFRDSKAGMVPSTLGMYRYISHSEIVCRGPKMFEKPWYSITPDNEFFGPLDWLHEERC
jgi:hypothetical protein